MRTIASIPLKKKKKNSVTLDVETHWVIGLGIGLDNFKGSTYSTKSLIIILPFVVLQLIFKKKSNK
jgi:hypothetical protein